MNDKSKDSEGTASLRYVSTGMTRSGMLEYGPCWEGPWIRFHGTGGSHGLDGVEAGRHVSQCESSRSRVNER